MVTKTPITGKKQLTERIAKKTKTPQNQVSRIIEELLEETKKALIKGEEVRLLGYFSFRTTMTTPRIAMNLQTKKKMKVPAKRVPKSKKTKLKNLNIEPLSVAKYFYEKGIEDMALSQRLIYLSYLEALKDGYLLFGEEWQA
ncbi:12330_t:CDS:2 [Ambispora gerdemannii]|uniref:12330_t:CDS:1 n=1 Tax=Ambispora gerdemannii TaxID=144530 RepID=A0A9N9HES8_9GLOM|nr:12330_t:CDS:2 [Ambispora gerdemannii]